MEYSPALESLLTRMADDSLIIAHRNSEWTGLAPTLEEDIAFSSIAQDKMGHALALYGLLHEIGAPEPNINAFMRDAKKFSCSHLVEYPIGGYDFSLMRHFLFDNAELIRYDMLRESSCVPLANLSKKVYGEIKYHVFHANTWVMQLSSQGTEESRDKMQAALNTCYPLALGLFEPSAHEDELIETKIFKGERECERRWKEAIALLTEKSGLYIPQHIDAEAGYGGRYGFHTEYLSPMLEEMTEVFRLDPAAEW